MLKTYQTPELLETLPPEVKRLFAIFGVQIRLVGGCVRDMLLQKKLNDFDFATPLLPQEVIEVLENQGLKAIPTGVKFGTVTAVVNGKNFEITTLRKDVENDGRHAVVEFVDDYFFDASRRDFTINALYLDSAGLIYDYFDGISDLKNQKVRFIGDAEERIKEDYLRILRFFRFSCKYSSELDLQGLEACIKNKNHIKSLSSDRIRNEVFKILDSAANQEQERFFSDLNQAEIDLEILNSAFNISEFLNFLQFTESLQIKVSSHLKFFILVNNNNLDWEEIFWCFNFSNKEKKYFGFLSQALKTWPKALEMADINELLAFEDKEFVYDFYLLNSFLALDSSDQNAVISNLSQIENFLLPKMPIGGEEFISLGLEGPKISIALKKIRSFWARGGFVANKQELLSLL